MPNRFCLALTLLLAVGDSFADSSSVSMTCNGTSTTYALNAPTDFHLDAPEPSTFAFRLASNNLSSSDLLMSGERFPLCRQTAREQTYSMNCKADPDDYIKAWMAGKDVSASQSQMMSKYGDQWLMLEYVKINVADGSITKEVIEPFSRPVFEHGKFIGARFFVAVWKFAGQCRENK